MKDSKVERVRQQVMILKQQFLQGDAGLFDQALGEQEVATIMSELETPHRERIYPPLIKGGQHRNSFSINNQPALHRKLSQLSCVLMPC